MNLKFLTASACLLITTALTGCSQLSSSVNPAPSESATPDAVVASPFPAASPAPVVSSPAAIAAAPPVASSASPVARPNPVPGSISPGEYCYQVKTQTQEGTARLTVDHWNGVSGQSRVAINNPEAGYFSSFTQSLSGVIWGDQLQLKVVTRIEEDIQQTEERWAMTPSRIDTGRLAYSRMDCSAVSAAPVPPPTVTASPSGRVEFAPGTDSAIIRSAVVRGTATDYQLRAAAGQTMTIRITSLEDNAVFDLIAPGSRILQQGATTWSGQLPADGDYDIVVSGTRGNATFELTVQIQ